MNVDFNKKSNDDENPESTYLLGAGLKLKLLLATILALVFGLILNFPMNDFVVTQVSKLIAHNQRVCPMRYDQIRFSLFFFPTLELDGLVLDGRCLGQPGISLKLGDTKATFLGPHFIPFGARVHLNTKFGKALLPVRLGLGITSSLIKIPEIQLKGSELSEIMPGFRSFDGTITTEGLIKLSSGKITEGHLFMESKDFKIPAQNIAGLAFGDTLFGNLLLKFSISSPTSASIDEFILGSSNSPMSATVNGKINLAQPQFGYSAMDLKGSMRFSADFIKQFPILNLLLSGKTAKDGAYSFTLKGSLSSPQFKIN